MTKSAPRPSLDSVTTIMPDGARRFIHAGVAQGRFTRWRALVAVVLTVIYVALPWVKINGHPAMLFDLAHRQFHYFGLTFVGQDIWIAFFVLTGLGFCLFFVTALLGRVWCGWACPQTVFLDFARRMERWCEGDAPARRRLDAAPWTFGKTVRRGAKHALYLLLSLLVAHVLLSYFVPLPRLYGMMRQSPWENWAAFAFVFGIAGALWFNFAWFREQFCIVLCPYGRLQSALIDSDSVGVGYDAKRGEPRGRKGTEGAGDCVDCLRCVQVCPTGIDIRQGMQLECIGCAACIDACDTVMLKLQRAPGLVRYDSTRGFEGKRTRWLRPRILLYTGLALVGAVALTLATSTLRSATVSLTRMVGIPYVVEHGTVRNQFVLRVLNKRNAAAMFRLEIAGGPPGLRWNGAETGIAVPPLGEAARTIVVTVPRTDTGNEYPLRFRLRPESGEAIEKQVTFLGPISP